MGLTYPLSLSQERRSPSRIIKYVLPSSLMVVERGGEKEEEKVDSATVRQKKCRWQVWMLKMENLTVCCTYYLILQYMLCTYTVRPD